LFASNAFADTIRYQALMNGPNESPPTSSPGTGLAIVIIDTTAHTMTISVVFSGLTTNTTAAHINCCTTTAFTGTAPVATMLPAFTNFPLGVTSGSMPTTTFLLTDAATYNPAFITSSGSVAAAEASLVASLAAGKTYFNIHTTANPGGEIRGF